MSTTSKPASLQADILAGLTASAVVLPKSMAFATVAGLPVSVGLYTAFVALLVYSWLGSSRVLSVSSTTTLAILAGSQLATAVSGGDAAHLTGSLAALTAMVGVMLLLASVLRLGFVANFISSPVLTGFKAGIGIVIVVDQLPKLLGLHIAKHGFIRDLASIVQHLGETSTLTLAVGVVTLVTLFALERLWPHSPAPILIVGLSIAGSAFWDLQAHGVSIVGKVPQGLPGVTLPDLGLLEGFVAGALGIALMSFTESIAAARAFSGPQDPPIDANRELAALGAANLAGAFLGGMPAGGGTSQTAVVKSAGGTSQVASMATAATALATMLLFAPMLGLLPNVTLAAVVIVYSVPLIQPKEFRTIRQVRALEFQWAVVACLGVLFFGTLQGIVVAIVASLLGLSSQTARPPVHIIGRKSGADVLRPLSPEHPEDETLEGLLILRPEGRLFFANAQYISDRTRQLVQEHQPKVLVLDMSRVFDLEFSVLQTLALADQRLTSQGQTIWFADFSPAALEMVRRSGLAEQLGERMLFNSREAIARYQSHYLSSDPTAPPGSHNPVTH